MNNILIGIKRFFTNKNTVTIIAVVLSICILYFFYNSRIEKMTEPKSIPYAISEIGPRTKITSDMIGIRKVPGGVVGKGDVLKFKNDIVGRYVKSNFVIPKGGVFYASSTTKEWEEAKSSLYEDIKDGNTLVSLPVTLESTYGNSIFPGNYIDLYYVGVERGKLLLDKFIESIKVLGVIDSNGNNVFEKTSKNMTSPSYLVFSVPEDYYLLLKKASYLSGNIFPVPRNASYSNNPKETSISSAYIQNFIVNQTVDVNSKDNLLNGGVTEFDKNNLGNESNVNEIIIERGE